MSNLSRLAQLAPREPSPDSELRDAFRLLDIDATPETYLRTVEGGAVALGAVGVVGVLAAPPGYRPVALLGVVLVAFSLREAGRLVPRLLAAAARRQALGTAPWLVCRAAMRLRVTPTTEAATAFASREPTGPLDRALAAAVRRGRATGTAGIDAFLARWGDRFPPLRRGMRLLERAVTAPTAERERDIDRALDTVLDGVRERASEDAAALRGPVTAVYAFGVLLPLAFVAALPATRAAGLPVSVPLLVVVYDGLLPLGLENTGGGQKSDRSISSRPVASESVVSLVDCVRDCGLCWSSGACFGVGWSVLSVFSVFST